MNGRKPRYPVLDCIVNRWSPRAFSGEHISDDELMSLFEAARWAPSSYNNQPWRFVYAKRDTSYWHRLFDLLVDANKVWVQNASVIVLIISYNLSPTTHKFARTHSFDTGAAWQNIALQAYANNLVAHGIAGFDYDRAKREYDLDDTYTVEAMMAIGKRTDKSILPAELQTREFPSGRNEVHDFAFEGIFKK